MSVDSASTTRLNRFALADSLLDELQRPRGNPDPATEQEDTTQESESSCLVSGSQRSRDKIPQGSDSEHDLQRHKVDNTKHALLRILRQHGAHAR